MLLPHAGGEAALRDALRVRLDTLGGLTPHEAVCRAWAD